MLSPLPPDPYAALGVPKDADLGQIRTAHRKLVLKYHPDRIRADNVDEKDKAKDEFQKAQQAYELLSDPSKRSRYDDQVRLAELQRERMNREAERPSQHHFRPAGPGPTTVRREMRTDGHIYEERAPPTSYFDSRDRFDDPIPRSPAARKHETPYEKERKPSATKPAEKKEKSGYRENSPIDISFRTAAGLKAAAARVRERERTKEGHAKSQETRDREKRRERTEKHFPKRSVYVEVESESDSDTATPPYDSRSRRTSPRPRPEPEPVRARPMPSRRDAYNHDDGPFSDDEKWENHHRTTMNYLAESSKRPGPTRNDSNAYVYWEGDFGGRKSGGSDNERKSSRRSKPDESRSRPTMPVHSSDPTYLRPNVEERTPQREKDRERSKTTQHLPERERPMPNLPRAHTMHTVPSNKSSKKTNLPTTGSNLKFSETQQDSGYYSSSSPHTPEMKGESPPPSRENSKKKNNTYKYQIVTPESDDDSRVSRVQILENDDAKYRRYRSPEPEKREERRERDRDRDRERERERDRDRDRDRERERGERPRERERPVRTDSSTKVPSNRAPPPTSFSRNEFRQEIPAPMSRGSPPVRQGSGKLFREITPDEKDNSYNYPYDASHVKTSSYQKPQYASHGSRHRDAEDEYAAPTSYKDPVRHAYYRRPSAVY